MLDKLMQHGIGVGGGSNIKSKQIITTTLLGTEVTVDISIALVNTNATTIEIDLINVGAGFGGTALNSRALVGEFINPTTIRISRGGGFGTSTVNFILTVKEYNNVKNKQVGITNFVGTDTPTKTITISSTDPIKSLALANFKASYNDHAYVFHQEVHAYLSTDTQLNLYTYPNSNYTKSVYWQVLEFN